MSITDTEETLTPQPHSTAITRLSVAGLFGEFDYELPSRKAGTQLPADVAILYGDNGTGKTTLLKLIFHALSPADDRRHRNAIADIAFKRFELELGSGIRLLFSRDADLTGGYWIFVSRPEGSPIQTNFNIQRENKFATEEHEHEFLSFLKSLNLSVYFVSATRTISGDPLPESEEPWQRLESESYAEQQAYLFARHHTAISDKVTLRHLDSFRAPSVTHAMSLAKQWITKQVLGAANRGGDSTQNVYAEVLRHIATSNVAETSGESHDTAKALIDSLQRLGQRSKDYARFKFLNPLDFDPMITVVRSCDPQHIPLLNRILRPYIQGTNARFDELQKVYEKTSLVVDRLRAFYLGKTVSFSLNRGFQIRRTKDKTLIDPRWLSSGEQQLLLLFCYTLVSSDRNSVFIIDEPEISLNVKWQRLLVATLLDLIKGGAVQFLLATHSIELIGRQLDHVQKLENVVESEEGVQLAS